MRGEKSAPRIAYAEGCLEIMSPSYPHECIKSMIGRLVEAWCFERNVDITPAGAWLLKEEAMEKGLEPDECYVLGEFVGEPARPDLAIEVIWTSGGIEKLGIYRDLAVREVWFWEDDAIEIFELRDGAYVVIPESGVLAGIDLPQLLQFVHITPMTKAVRAYRAALST